MQTRQIVMRRYHLHDLPPIILPDGCGIRTYQPGDEQAWADIMNTGIGSDWNVDKVMENLINRPQFLPEGLFFATLHDKPVGTACAWRSSPEESYMGIVHMVCVLPEARGKNLGYLVTLRVLYFFRDHGFKEVILSTDDHRIAAIKAYLRLGFKPFHVNITHYSRWKTIISTINSSSPT